MIDEFLRGVCADGRCSGECRRIVIARRHPDWIKSRAPTGAGGRRDACDRARARSPHRSARKRSARTSASAGRTTRRPFMLLGDTCTRNVPLLRREPRPADRRVDPDEPRRVAEAVARLGLRHVVMTSVEPRRPAGRRRRPLRRDRARRCTAPVPECTIEVLIPDLQGDHRALATVVARADRDSEPQHRDRAASLQARPRREPRYERSLGILRGRQACSARDCAPRRA